MPIHRRSLLAAALPRILHAANPASVAQNEVAEFTLTATRPAADPFNDLELDAIFTGPAGAAVRVPAFWAGGQTWKFRFAFHATGVWKFTTEARGQAAAGLSGQTGELRVTPYRGDNPLLKHGPIRITPNRRGFQHADGTPFFFLGDDWWLGLTSRLRFPGEFKTLVEDRKRKGYTTIKLTAGLNTDCYEFDPRNANEGGQPWEPGYTRIRPGYFDWADRRIEFLVNLGLSPSIVGSWGFYLKSMGVPKMNQHWRYCSARWGAYPVTWYLAMENDLPFYGTPLPWTEEIKRAQAGWTEAGKYLRTVNPFHRPVSMQSWSTRDSARGGLADAALLDFDSLHMGHGDRESALNCVRVVRSARELEPRMPVVPGEVCFEGIGWQNWQNIQRLVFWGSMLGGAAGFCYGANGIWQFNRRDEPFGGTARGDSSWEGDPWDVAMNYPGSAQVGLGKQFLSRYEWWKLEPHQEWIEPQPRTEAFQPPYAGGIPGLLRLVYVPFTGTKPKAIRSMERGVRYRAFWWSPVTGAERPLGVAEGNSEGVWPAPALPGKFDALLVLDGNSRA
jgi:hypothetical protein